MKIIDNNEEIINNIREIYKTAPAHKIHQLIAKHFIPSIEEKKENAEIPTPIILVEEMLDKIPDEFWKTPKKVFEPCCGKGNFVMKIFEKFFNGLTTLYPDENKRCNIIIKDCLYYADLTPLNVFITTEILKCEIESRCDGIIEYNFNKYTGDTLEMDINKEFNIDKFDAVIGNPPYHDGSGNKGKGHTLWTKFIIVSLNKFVKENGYLVYVHPSVWRQINHPCLNIIKDKQLIYLEIHNVDDGLKIFKCATRYDWYVLQNKLYEFNTIIKGEDGKINNINLKEWLFIPNMMFCEIKKLVINENDNKNMEKIKILHSESYYEVRQKWMSHLKTEKNIHPCVYSINKKNEISLKWSEIKTKGHFNECKFIFTNGAGFCCDNEGIYGLTQWASGIVDSPEKLPLIEKAFRSVEFNNIKNAIQLDSSSYNIKVMQLFKKDFYNDFLNEEENKFIIVKKGKTNYYLIDDKLYKIKKNKTKGEYYCDYNKEKM